MRRSIFGDYYATSTEDDIAEAFVAMELHPSECFADVCQDGDNFYVEIRDNEGGELVVQTDDDLFASAEAAREWARTWVSHVNDNF